MSELHPVSKQRHADKCWQRYVSYSFTAKDAVVALVAAELPKACIAFPLGFLKSEQDTFLPVAVLGLAPGRNLFVTQDGRWIGGYIPAAYRSFPFRLATTPDQQHVLCVDEASGLVQPITSEQSGERPKGTKWERFFDDEDQPTGAVKDILDFLTQVEKNRLATQVALQALVHAALIVPWEIHIKDHSGSEQKIDGLFRIDEARLNSLSIEEFDAVRKASGLAIAYCQLLSMQHLPLLGQLVRAHQQAQAQSLARPPVTPTGEIDFSFLADGDTIGFGSSGAQ